MAEPVDIPPNVPVVFKEPIDVAKPREFPPTVTTEEDPELAAWAQRESDSGFFRPSGSLSSPETISTSSSEQVSGGGSTIRTSSGTVRLNPDGTVVNDVPTVETGSGVENGVTSFTFTPKNPNAGLQGQKQETRSQGDLQNTYLAKGDWRVRLSLAAGAAYLYNDPVEANSGILAPLRATGGVVFPYTPGITIAYAANYESTKITHSNYPIFQYQSSGIESIQIAADFTAQDASEATYLLAVIHFLRTVTKMFYGQDQNPKAGTPPPLCFLHGLGAFQFDNHPLVISNFTYQLPDEVDYIRAGTVVPVMPGESIAPQQPKKELNALQTLGRLVQNLSKFKIGPGGELEPPDFIQPGSYKVQEPTYVPTRIKIQLTALPVVSRNDISNTFSLQQYGSGSLMRGSLRRGGGIW